MDKHQVGGFIAERRKRFRLTQGELAEKLGISQQDVLKWEEGKQLPDTEVIPKLCAILNITINELLCGRKLKEEEERKEAEQNAYALLKNKQKIKNFKLFYKLLCVMCVVIALLFAAAKYYVWCSEHPTITFKMSEGGKGDAYKIEEPVETIEERHGIKASAKIEYKILLFMSQHHANCQYIYDTYKASDIQLDIEAKENQTILRYTGTVTTYEDEVLPYDEELELGYSIPATFLN